jgi:hypothetical protein
MPNGPSVVIISEPFWRTRFGADSGVIGRLIEVNGLSREIVGVMPADFRFPEADTRLAAAVDPTPRSRVASTTTRGAARPGVSKRAAQRDSPRCPGGGAVPDLAPGFR